MITRTRTTANGRDSGARRMRACYPETRRWAVLRLGADMQRRQQDVPAVRAADDVVGLRPAPDRRVVRAPHGPIDRRGRAARAQRLGGQSVDRPVRAALCFVLLF